ncbi:MAG: hypothetical protein ACSHYF_13030 [Verrucomicrobiaceae bacterium]
MKSSTLLLSLLAAPLLHAAPFDPSHLSGDAQWFLHADLEALQKTTVGKTALQAIRADHKEGLLHIQETFHVDLSRDIRNVTLFGDGAPNRAAVLIDGGIDRKHLEQVIGYADDYDSFLYQGATVHTWTDKDGEKKQFAAFHADDLAIVSEHRALVELSLDVFGGRKPPMESVSSPAENPVVLAMANVENIKLKDDGGSAIVRKAKHLAMTIRESGEKVEAQLIVSPQEAKNAERLQKVMDGLMALGMLASEELEQLSIEHQTTVEEGKVHMTMTLPVDQAIALLAGLGQ